MHFNMNENPIDQSSLRQNMQRYTDIGLEIHITELDVCCGYTTTLTCTSDQYYNEGREISTGQMYAGELSTYLLFIFLKENIVDILSVCLEFPNCRVFETWGFTDKYSWRNSSAYPLPFDIDFNAKTAVDDMLNVLQGI
jgi:endo-1,4-beta-xylanase